MGIKNISLPLWLSSYDRAFLKSDIGAGFTVAVMLVPQGMAYAMLAELPPVYGIYASTLPIIVYALLGSSRHLAVGPVAILSLLVAAACSKLAAPGSAEYLQLVALLTLMVGALQLVLGAFRAGSLSNFVSHAVASGFISAAAVIIGLNQVRHIFGIDIESGHSLVSLATGITGALTEIQIQTAVLGIGASIVLFAVKRIRPHLPAALIVVIFSTVSVYLLQLHEVGIAIVGETPSGLPRRSDIRFDANAMASLFPAALAILFVGYMESMTVAQWVASREKYRIYPNREFLALGAANVVAGLFSGYVVTGGVSRTAVNYQSGAKTPLASMVTAVLVLLVVLFFTPWFYYLPNAVLGAIIIVAVIGLVDVRAAVKLFRFKRADGWTWLVTFIVTLLIGFEHGILVGVVFSLVLFVARSARPHAAVLGYVEREDAYHDVQRYPDAVTLPRLVILRIDASLYFANARFVEDYIREQLAMKPDVNWLILDMSGVNDIDGVAVTTLENLLDDYEEQGLRLVLAGAKAQVRDVLQEAQWYSDPQRALHYPTLHQAVAGLPA